MLKRLAQHLIADTVPERIIDGFEMVDIDDEDRYLRGRYLRG